MLLKTAVGDGDPEMMPNAMRAVVARIGPTRREAVASCAGEGNAWLRHPKHRSIVSPFPLHLHGRLLCGIKSKHEVIERRAVSLAGTHVCKRRGAAPREPQEVVNAIAV